MDYRNIQRTFDEARKWGYPGKALTDAYVKADDERQMLSGKVSWLAKEVTEDRAVKPLVRSRAKFWNRMAHSQGFRGHSSRG